MNKAELIAKIAEDAGISKEQAEKALGAFTGAVTDSLKSGNKIALVGFGTFDVRSRATRIGRRRSGAGGDETDDPGASLTRIDVMPRFKAGKALRDAVN